MNQHQRKFLLEAVEKQFKIENDALRKRRPTPPSLNNYLIAAILDGSFVMRSQAAVRDAIRERVQNLGKEDAFVRSGEGKWGFGRRRDADDEPQEEVQIPVGILFDLPKPYTVKMAEYEAAKASWEAEVAALEASIGAMRIKVQIGSDKALEALVEQADQLCSMSLTATNKLLLGNAERLLGNGGDK